MKKNFTRTLAAVILTACSSFAMAQKTVTLNTYNAFDFGRITEKTAILNVSRYFFYGYNTICLPFSVSADELKAAVGDGVMLEQLAKVEGNELTFVDVTEKGIEAGMPYIIYSPTKQAVKFTTTDFKNLAVAPKNLTVDGVTMSGHFEPTKENDLYGIPAAQDTEELQSILVKTVSDKTFLPSRCGIKFAGATETPTIKHVTSINEETAINVLKAQNALVDIYNVAGTLVQKNVRINYAIKTLSHGIYVVNGQKFMVK